MDLAEYIRMSTNHQEDSPEVQKKVNREYCAAHGHNIVKTYQDLGKSGGSIDGREDLLNLLNDTEKNFFEGVIIYKLDRAFRNLGEQIVALKKLKQYDKKLIASADPVTEGPAGDLVTNIIGAVNQFERELIGERIKHHNREVARKGKWTGGSCAPFGYDYDREAKQMNVNEEEAKILRKLYEIFVETEGTSVTAWELNSLGLKTKKGLSWSPRLVKNILSNPFYAGMTRYGFCHKRKEEGKVGRKVKYARSEEYSLYPGQHQAIISKEAFDEVQYILNNKKTYKKQSERVYVFTGIFKCRMCGGNVSGAYYQHIQKKGYRCNTHINRKDDCKGFNKVEHKIETAIYKAINENYLLIMKLNQANPRADIEIKQLENDLKEKIKNIDITMSRQVKLYEARIYDDETFFGKRKKSLAQKEEIENKLKTVNESKGLSMKTENIIQLLTNFHKMWPMRWKAPLQYRILIHSIIKEIYSDGKILEVFFVSSALPGWKEHVVVDL